MERSEIVGITGATGLIGRALIAELLRRGYRVRAFVRNVDRARRAFPAACELVRYALGDGEGLEESLEGLAAVVNLAGEPLFKPFTGRRTLRRVTQERIDGAQRLAQACSRARRPPRVLVQASSVGVYGFGRPAADAVDEDAAPLPGEHSQGSLAWERAALDNPTATRVVLLRLGYVLSAKGGGLPYQLAEAAKGKVSFFQPGGQWIPWVHLDDVVAIAVAAIRDASWSGPYNVVAPEAMTAAQFAAALSAATGAGAPARARASSRTSSWGPARPRSSTAVAWCPSACSPKAIHFTTRSWRRHCGSSCGTQR